MFSRRWLVSHVFGIIAIPCCTNHRKMTCGMVLPYLAAIGAITGLLIISGRTALDRKWLKVLIASTVMPRF